jgi:hypothetical protein
MTMTTSESPRVGEFGYKVSVEVWLPLPHAEVLHATALHHYDSTVRSSACAGPINGLRNVARWASERAAEGEDPPLPMALRFSELDTALKALERPVAPEADGPRLVCETRAVILDAMARINARTRALDDTAAELARSTAEREALLRLVKVWPRRVARIDLEVSNAAGDSMWRVLQQHPDGHITAVSVRADTHDAAIEAARYILPYFPEEAFAP